MVQNPGTRPSRSSSDSVSSPTLLVVPRPAPGEHAPYASTYVEATARELARRGDSDLLALLAAQPSQLGRLLEGVDPALGSFAYAPGKWTLAQAIVHVSDAERVFSYRLLRIARNDPTPLPGYEQDDWVPESRATGRSIDNLLEEFGAARNSTLALIRSLDELALTRTGTAGEHPTSARALVWIIAGHVAHHMQVFSERYLASAAAR